MLIFLRSVLYALVMAITTPISVTIANIVAHFFSPVTRFRIVSHWAWINMHAARWICGIRYRVIGAEHLAAHPAVIMAKHQSAWETIAFQRLLPPISFVLKKELLRVPVFGWGLAAMPFIAIDRSAGKDALQQVVDQGKQRLAEGLSVMIFPEGTRSAPGEKRRYKIGGATLAVAAGVPVIPVAHNAGEFWRKGAFLKYPGEVIVSIGAPIPSAGLTEDELLKRVEAWIEGEMHTRFPHHYKGGAAAASAAVQEV